MSESQKLQNTDEKLSSMSRDELCQLSRNDLVANCKTRGIAVLPDKTKGEKYLNKQALADRLLRYLDQFENELDKSNLDDTLYLTCADIAMTDEDESETSGMSNCSNTQVAGPKNSSKTGSSTPQMAQNQKSCTNFPGQDGQVNTSHHQKYDQSCGRQNFGFYQQPENTQNGSQPNLNSSQPHVKFYQQAPQQQSFPNIDPRFNQNFQQHQNAFPAANMGMPPTLNQSYMQMPGMVYPNFMFNQMSDMLTMMQQNIQNQASLARRLNEDDEDISDSIYQVSNSSTAIRSLLKRPRESIPKRMPIDGIQLSQISEGNT